MASGTAQGTLPWSRYSDPQLRREQKVRRGWQYAGPAEYASEPGQRGAGVRAVLLGAAVLAAATAGCGGSPPSTESVVRAWSQALNTDDNERAADLFARDAEVVQGDTVTTLRTHGDAVRWNSSLPCSGRIVSITTKGQTATATFVLGDRQHSRCDGPGEHATAIFRVVKGKIVLWHQTEAAAPPASTA